MMPDFKKYGSIQRLSSETCHITEKIDGTNGIIYIPQYVDEPVIAGSRERWLSNPDGTPPEKVKDNYGFAAWVYERAALLRALGPGVHYGEFFGLGIQRKYDMPRKAWVSFEFWRDENRRPLMDDVYYIPVLYSGEYNDAVIVSCIERLRIGGSVLCPGFMEPEGVVITLDKTKVKFKKFLKNDTIKKGDQK